MTPTELKNRIEKAYQKTKELLEEIKYIANALSTHTTDVKYLFESEPGLEPSLSPVPVPVPVPESGSRSTAPKYEFRGMDCPIHRQAPHRKTNGSAWVCVECYPAT